MLSAVAARKLRLQSKEPAPLPAPATKPPSPLPSPPRSTPRKASQKRKVSEQTPKPRKRTKQQHKNAENTRARYFEQEDSFQKQEDVIVVEDDEDVSDASISDSDDVLDSVDFTQVPQGPYAPPAQGVRPANRKRAWSPSAPLPDSSEDEDEEQLETGGATAHTGPSALHTLVDQAPPELTHFEFLVDANTFQLTSEDLRSLRLEAPFAEQNGVVLLISASDTLAFAGTYALTVLRGAVSLGGVVLAASAITHRVFAPRSSPLPVIAFAHGDDRDLDTMPLPARIRSAVSSDVAVVLVQELHTGVEGLGRVCRTFEGAFKPSRWQNGASSAHLGLQGVHVITGHAQDAIPMVIPPPWEIAMSAATQANAGGGAESAFPKRVYLVKGARNSGKSTFARTLLNRLSIIHVRRYRRVAYLDCDVGQSEFTPGGMVALNVLDRPQFGPPFTHPSIPYASHYIGATSPRSSPSHYLDAIQALIQTYNLDIQHAILDDDAGSSGAADARIADHIPLVVNTMGWTKGLGSDLARRIEEMLEPSDIFEFEVPVPEDAWAAERPHVGGASQDGVTLHALEAVPPSVLSNYYTAADHRTLSVLSYFHAVFPQPEPSVQLRSVTATSWSTSLPLCARPPYEVDWTVAFDRVVLTGAGMEDVVPSEIERVLNGAVVALVSREPGTLDADEDAVADADAEDGSGPINYKQGAPPPSPSTSKCVGLALIRSIAPATQASVLHMLTPVPPSLLSDCRTLVKGELELPVWGMLDFRSVDGADVAGAERSRVPYLRWGKGEGAGGGRRRVRRNLMRRGQM
ncbi:hypothetical protein OBBRIDRAFT_814272 [Obba rivulosa]|uniref:Polynucleotide 5'-hydroxyl-kinase GRC3 n=1 Tax=Obba rivulosa TaxID=1052685 RepID=A0A8E2APN3_9APHY|nr:hypothetical protein OBBRIDRAFT_814272 [Obba rivulosa]